MLFKLQIRMKVYIHPWDPSSEYIYTVVDWWTVDGKKYIKTIYFLCFAIRLVRYTS
jgi:hypothetical protein